MRYVLGLAVALGAAMLARPATAMPEVPSATAVAVPGRGAVSVAVRVPEVLFGTVTAYGGTVRYVVWVAPNATGPVARVAGCLPVPLPPGVSRLACAGPATRVVVTTSHGTYAHPVSGR